MCLTVEEDIKNNLAQLANGDRGDYMIFSQEFFERYDHIFLCYGNYPWAFTKVTANAYTDYEHTEVFVYKTW